MNIFKLISCSLYTSNFRNACYSTTVRRALKIENFYKEGLVSGVGGVTVSMVAFQAAVPGSTPGRRMFLFVFNGYFLGSGYHYFGRK